MKQNKAMIVALIVICITAVVAALVPRQDLCEVHIRPGQTEDKTSVRFTSDLARRRVLLSRLPNPSKSNGGE